jgi:hypothetical protein
MLQILPVPVVKKRLEESESELYKTVFALMKEAYEENPSWGMQKDRIGGLITLTDFTGHIVVRAHFFDNQIKVWYRESGTCTQGLVDVEESAHTVICVLQSWLRANTPAEVLSDV